MTRHLLETTTNKIKTKYQIGSRRGQLLGYNLSLHEVQTNALEALLRRTKLIAFVSSPNSWNSFREGTALLTNSSHLKSHMFLVSHTYILGGTEEWETNFYANFSIHYASILKWGPPDCNHTNHKYKSTIWF